MVARQGIDPVGAAHLVAGATKACQIGIGRACCRSPEAGVRAPGVPVTYPQAAKWRAGSVEFDLKRPGAWTCPS